MRQFFVCVLLLIGFALFVAATWTNTTEMTWTNGTALTWTHEDGSSAGKPTGIGKLLFLFTQ